MKFGETPRHQRDSDRQVTQMVGDLKGTGCTTWQWLEVDSSLVLKALS